MPTVNVQSADHEVSRAIELPAEVFDAQTNIPLIHQVVTAQLAAARQGTHDTKTRGEVRGGGKKPYRQKGTGRARQGSTRAPQFAGGGVVHGPTPRDYAQRTPKKMKAAALRGVLSDRARDGRIHVFETLLDSDVPSTKQALTALGPLAGTGRCLVVLDRSEETAWRSVRNVPSVHVLAADQLNTYDVVVSDQIVFTIAGLTAFLSVRGIDTLVEVSPEQEVVQAAAEPRAEEPATSRESSEEPAAELDSQEPEQPTQQGAEEQTEVTE